MQHEGRPFAVAFALVAHPREAPSQFHISHLRHAEGWEELLEPLHDLLDGDGLGVAWRLLGWQVGECYHLLVAAYLPELLVLLHDACVFLLLEPVAAALPEFLAELCVEQVVGNDIGIVDFVGIDADEPS